MIHNHWWPPCNVSYNPSCWKHLGDLIHFKILIDICSLAYNNYQFCWAAGRVSWCDLHWELPPPPEDIDCPVGRVHPAPGGLHRPHLPPDKHKIINTLRQRQNGRHFADDTFKPIFFNENIRILIKKFHWSLFLRFQSTLFQRRFR